MTYLIDTQSLVALNEQQLLVLYSTLKAELDAMPPGGPGARVTSEAINRVLAEIKARQRWPRPRLPGPGF